MRKNGKPDCHRCAFAGVAFHQHFPAVQFGAPLHQKETKSGAGTMTYVATSMKCSEQLPLILLGNSDPLVLNDAHGFISVSLDAKMHSRSWLRIFYGVAE